MPQCTACNLTFPRTSSCSRCKTAQYCSKSCQTTHWPTHKPLCKRPNYIVRFQIYPEEITNPPVWRTLSVPADITFAKLHDALQIAFEWDDIHCFEFVVNDPDRGSGQNEPSLMDLINSRMQQDRAMLDGKEWAGDPTAPREYLLRITDDRPETRRIDAMHLPNQAHPRTPTKSASSTKLYQVLDNEKYRTHPLTYIYDLGDFWLHELQIVPTVPFTSNTISCIDGSGHPIAEDCGSSQGWNDLLEAARATHPTEEQEWMLSMAGVDHEDFANGGDRIWDREEVNRQLGRLA